MKIREIFQEVEIIRKSNESSTIVLETSDPTKMFSILKSSGDLEEYNDVYVFYDKLYKVNYIERIRGEKKVRERLLEPVDVGQGLLSGTPNYITDINNAMEFMNNILFNGKKVLFIMFLIHDNVNKNKLSKNLFVWTSQLPVTNEGGSKTTLYENKNTVMIITDDISKYVVSDIKRYIPVINVDDVDDIVEYLEKFKVVLKKKFGINLSKNDIMMVYERSRGLAPFEIENIISRTLIEVSVSGKFGKTKFLRRLLENVKNHKKEIIRKTGFMELIESDITFQHIGGYEQLKSVIKSYIIDVLKEPKLAQSLGVELPRGILLFGPPGTGKTLFAKALASELGLPFINFKIESLMTKWYGETEKNVLKAIELIESISPAVVFIDEIDRIGRRTGNEHEVSSRVFGVLLEWLGNKDRKSIVIGTTNRPDLMDDAFIRVGRFDYVIPVLYPDFDARREIFMVHTNVQRKVPLGEDVDFDELARRTELFTGAEIEEVVKRATRYAFIERRDVVTMDDFIRAISSLYIDFENRNKQVEMYRELTKKYTNDREILSMLYKF